MRGEKMNEKPIDDKGLRASVSETITICLLLLAVSFIVYAPALQSYFVADDFGFVDLFLRQSLRDAPRLFVSDWTQSIWKFNLYQLRPVSALAFMWDAALWQSNPLGYHVTNVLLHAACSALVFIISRLLLRAEAKVALFAALLFAVHPAHIEAVAWISARTELLPTFFYLCSFLTFGLYRMKAARIYYCLSTVTFLLGLFSKEMVISLPLMLIAYDVILERRTFPGKYGRWWQQRWWLPHAGFAIVTMGYLLLRKFAFGSSAGGLAVLDFVGRQGFYLSHLFPPVGLMDGVIGNKWLFLLWFLLLSVLCLTLLTNTDLQQQVRAKLTGAWRSVIFFSII